MIEKLLSINEEIRESFKDDWSGIYLFTGKFVHIKGYRIKGINRGALSIGSNNMTQASLQSNEEAMIFMNYGNNVPGIVRDFENYLEELYVDCGNDEPNRCVYIEDYEPNPRNERLDEFLLDGEIWNQLNPSDDPYRFPLDLPADLIDQAAPNIEEFRGYLDADLQNSLNSKVLIKRALANVNVDDVEEDEEATATSGRSNAMWKKFTIETNLGNWALTEDHENINAELEKINANLAYHRNNMKYLNEFREEIEDEFRKFIEIVIRRIEIENIRLYSGSRWRRSVSQWINDWREHVQKLEQKLDDDDYLFRLAKGVSCTSVPDFRSDYIALHNFTQSFRESFIYWRGKPRTSKVLVNNETCKRLVENWL